jgi:hypothetical protein
VPLWLDITLGVVGILLVCAGAEHYLGVDLAGAIGKTLAALFVAAVFLSAIYGLFVLIMGDDPLGLGFDESASPEPCQELPVTDPRAC